MIKLIETPQRSDTRVKYAIQDDVLTVIMNSTSEVFDFTDLPEGISEEVIAETLTVSPILSVEKIGDIVNVTVIRFYGEDEKHLFEVV